METQERTQEEELIAKNKAKTSLLLVGMISIVMMFAAFCSAFIVSKGGNFWVNINMPSAFWLSTATILVSSITINLALAFIKRNNRQFSNLMLALTLVLGLVFAGFQWVGWKQMINKGNYFVGNIMDPENPDAFFVKGEYGKDFTITFNKQELKHKEGRLFFPDGKELSDVQYDNLKMSRNTASSYIFLLTFLHVLHVLGGLIYLSSVTVRGYSGQFDQGNYLKIKLISIYWHFLDALWLFLFLFLQFIH